MESNISRDHIALEAMKIIINASLEEEQTLWNKIKVLFGGKSKVAHKTVDFEKAAYLAYKYADAMIEERMKIKQINKPLGNETE